METKKNIWILLILIICIAAGMAGAMTFSYQHGKANSPQMSVETESVDVREEQHELEMPDDTGSAGRTNDEALGKITGEDDDFTLVADPANFDVTILGYDDAAQELASPMYDLHKQMKAWMDENEFWDMTEVVYTGKYLRDDTNNVTTLYFKIIRYPDSPLLATWNSTTAQYEFAIEWN